MSLAIVIGNMIGGPGATGSGGGSSYILDTYPNALGAFSLRKLRSGYSGSPIRIRRNTIGFGESVKVEFDSNDEVSMDSPVTAVVGTTLATNLGEFLWAATYANPDGLPAPARSNTVKWYDQSGNGFDLEQTASPAWQPPFNGPGAFYDLNGKPSIFFDGSNDELTEGSVFGLGNTSSDVVHYSVQQFEDNRWIMARGGHNGDYYLQGFDVGTLQPYGSSPGTNPPNVIFKNGVELITPDQGDVFDQFSNIATPPAGQTLLTFTGIDFVSWNPVAFPIGYELWGYDGVLTKGRMQELILYNSPNHPNQADMETAINDYYTIF